MTVCVPTTPDPPGACVPAIETLPPIVPVPLRIAPSDTSTEPPRLPFTATVPACTSVAPAYDDELPLMVRIPDPVFASVPLPVSEPP